VTTGVSAAGANTALDSLVGGYAQLHTGDPGASGVANAASVTTRQSLTWPSSSAGQTAISNQPQWAAWGGSQQTITHLSMWTAASSGTFKASVQLATPVVVQPAGSVTVTALSATLGPVAA
jgi:hypothetical protein